MRPFFRYLDATGDGSGNKNFNGDYSLGQEIAYFNGFRNDTNDLSETCEVHRMIISYEDTAGMQAEEYGNLAAALTNGIEIKLIDDDGTIIDLTDGIPIKTNAQWGQLCYDVDVKSWGSGNELLVARWTFSKAGGPLTVNPSKNVQLAVYLDDNFTGLLSHYFMVQGIVYD